MDVERLWQMFLRRFDIEHTFRLFKQTLGWTAPKIRTPQAADRWTWMIVAVYTQLRLARHLADTAQRDEYIRGDAIFPWCGLVVSEKTELWYGRDQEPRVRVGRMAEHLVRRSHFHDGAAAHADDRRAVIAVHRDEIVARTGRFKRRPAGRA